MSIVNTIISNNANINIDNIKNITANGNTTHTTLNATGRVYANNTNLRGDGLNMYTGEYEPKIHCSEFNINKILCRDVIVDVVNVAIHNTIDNRCYYALGLKKNRNVSLLYCPTIIIDNRQNGKINENIKFYVNGTLVNVDNLSGLGQQSDSSAADADVQAWTVAAYNKSYIVFFTANGPNFSSKCRYTIQRFTYT